MVQPITFQLWEGRRRIDVRATGYSRTTVEGHGFRPCHMARKNEIRLHLYCNGWSRKKARSLQSGPSIPKQFERCY